MWWIFIKQNIRENLSLETLSEKACMSKGAFFQGTFKAEFGLVPYGVLFLEERFEIGEAISAVGAISSTGGLLHGRL
jgi:AraC family transcriptional regulator